MGSLIFTLVVIGVVLYFFNTLATVVDPRIKTVVNGLVLLGVLWLVLSFLGIVGPVPTYFRR